MEHAMSTNEFSEISVKIDMHFEKKVLHDDNYKSMPYAQLIFEGQAMSGALRVNEHISIIINLICNTMVIAVFVRVLGLARLPSQIIVSLSCSNMVFALGQFLHTTSIVVKSLADSVEDCRIVTLTLTHCWALQYNGLAAALLERILACNVPSFYSRNMTSIGLAVLITPWAFCVINMIMTVFQFYDFDLGYECSSHLNNVEPEACMYIAVETALVAVNILLVILGITFLVRDKTSSDVWEINRMKFEVMTTIVMLKIGFLSLIVASPVVFYSLAAIPDGTTYEEAVTLHLLNQISTYMGLNVAFVCLTRQEFRKNMRLVCKSRADIARVRTHNLMVQQPSSGSANKLADADKSRIITSGIKPPEIIQLTDDGMACVRPVKTKLETPNWLLKEETSSSVASDDKKPVPGFLSRWFGSEKQTTKQSISDNQIITISLTDPWCRFPVNII